jgi:hypothetical protein
MFQLLSVFPTTTFLDGLNRPCPAHQFPGSLEALFAQIEGTSIHLALAVSKTVVVLHDNLTGQWLTMKVKG